jgi:hypothetical protein
MKPKRRRPCNVRVNSRALPMSLDELARSGGPNAMIQQVERQASDQEARFWLETLEAYWLATALVLDLPYTMILDSWIKSLRRRLGVKPTPEAIRAQTRERVRRFRERMAGDRHDPGT